MLKKQTIICGIRETGDMLKKTNNNKEIYIVTTSDRNIMKMHSKETESAFFLVLELRKGLRFLIN